MTQIAINNSNFSPQSFGHVPETMPTDLESNVAFNRTATSHSSQHDNKVDKEPYNSQSVTRHPSDESVENDGLPSMANGARYANGTLGYVADPTALRKGVASFLKLLLVDNDSSVRDDKLYWKLLMDYESTYRNGTFSGNEILSPDFICAPGPGRGYEQDYGYKLLTEKIRIHPNRIPNKSSLTVLCLVYTYPKMRDLQRTQALSWGLKCDGYLAFSTETIASLGIVHLQHEGEESYHNMWQKVRSIWNYVYKHYRHDYDFFHLGGDDLYVIVENLRQFLSETSYKQQRHAHNGEAIYLGQWIPQPGGDKPYYVSGGPGYTLNRAALVRLVEDALPTCRVHLRVSYEDRLVSQCFREIGIIGGDTREVETGEQLYHDCGPAHLYTFRSTKGRGSFHAKAASYWETLIQPNGSSSSKEVGPKHGLDAAGTYSVTFHDIYHPLYVARLHSILYPATCPATSPLGRGLYAHSWTN
jgi:hypothetical protein